MGFVDIEHHQPHEATQLLSWCCTVACTCADRNGAVQGLMLTLFSILLDAQCDKDAMKTNFLVVIVNSQNVSFKNLMRFKISETQGHPCITYPAL